MRGLVRPVAHAPALVVRAGRGGASILVLADLHLGLAATPAAPGGPPGASGPELAEAVLRACRAARARRLVVAGDVKHPIVGAPHGLRPVIFDFFGTLLSEGIAPEVVLGNHDVGLARHLPREVEVHGPEGIVREGVGIFHGHRWPSREVLASRTLVAGHLHPGYRLAATVDAPEGKRRCWVRVRFEVAPAPPRARGFRGGARELIVLPAFHPLAGVEALNRERPERGRSFLYARFLSLGLARAYLLDGTDLGTLVTPRPAAPPGSVRRAPRAR